MITVGDNPERASGINKFIGEGGEGHRGKMIALRVDGTSAIVLAMTSSLNVYDGVQWGRFYQVEETGGPAEYPRVLRRVESIPEMKEWRIV